MAGTPAAVLWRCKMPGVQVVIGLFVAKACDEGFWGVDGVGNAVATFHEHGAAAGHAAGDSDVMFFDAFWVQFVDIRLEASDYGSSIFPVPNAHGGFALTAGDLL